MANEIVNKLCSKAKLDRDRGYEDFKLFVTQYDVNNISEIEQVILQLFDSSEQEWEYRHGALSGARCILEQIHLPAGPVKKGKLPPNCDIALLDGEGDTFPMILIDKSMALLDHEEFRVRIASG